MGRKFKLGEKETLLVEWYFIATEKEKNKSLKTHWEIIMDTYSLPMWEKDGGRVLYLFSFFFGSSYENS